MSEAEHTEDLQTENDPEDFTFDLAADTISIDIEALQRKNGFVDSLTVTHLFRVPTSKEVDQYRRLLSKVIGRSVKTNFSGAANWLWGKCIIEVRKYKDLPENWKAESVGCGHVDGRHFFLSGREVRSVRQPIFCRLPTTVWQQHSAQETRIAGVDEATRRRISTKGFISQVHSALEVLSATIERTDSLRRHQALQLLEPVKDDDQLLTRLVSSSNRWGRKPPAQVGSTTRNVLSRETEGSGREPRR